MKQLVRFYKIRLVQELAPGHNEPVWFAEHPDLNGCHAVAETPEAALEGLERSRRAWLEVARELGIEIPVPDGGALDILVQYLPNKTAAKAKADSEAETQEIPLPSPTVEYAN